MRSLVFFWMAAVCSGFSAEVGIFDSTQDIGAIGKKGSSVFSPSDYSYRVSGGGENMWFTNDAFHFVWKQVSGDFALESAIAWAKAGGNAHRKACLMVRQSLAPDAAYVDVAVHGDGLTSLQFRETAGGLTHEIQFNTRSPIRVGIERQSNSVFGLWANSSDGPLKVSGAFTRIQFADPVYVGLGVCAHDNAALEEARFTQVKFTSNPPRQAKPVLHSSLERISIASKDRRVVFTSRKHFEAPNWAPDPVNLLFNSGGRILRIPAVGGEPSLLDTGFANRCNNDHGLSADGKWLAISDQSKDGKSRIYVLPATGGEPRLVTPEAPSYWHGWSPDGATLVYCAERNGEYDVYSIPTTGGAERRLTTAKGLDDGPEFSPDGKWIYFNSDRTGTMQIWRMKPDGSEQTPVTADSYNNWFAHPSPDGKWLVFLSYGKSVSGHPANQDVKLRLMSLANGQIQDLARLFGGQGTINVPSWSPDSRNLAFVSYELLRDPQ